MPHRPFKRTNPRDPFNPGGAGRRLPGAPAPRKVQPGPLDLAGAWRRSPRRVKPAKQPRRADEFTRKVL